VFPLISTRDLVFGPQTMAETRGITAQMNLRHAQVNGEFFASAPKKMTGPLHRVKLKHVIDRASQEAA
jgi:hypothetical protein